MKIKLIEQWRSFWRMWSLRLNAAGVLVLGYITTSPEIIMYSWNALPADLKNMLPPNYLMWISLSLFVLGMFARVVKQKNIPKAPDNGSTENDFEKP